MFTYDKTQLRFMLAGLFVTVIAASVYGYHRLDQLEQERNQVVVAMGQLQDSPKIAAPPPLRAEPRGTRTKSVEEPQHSTVEIEAMGAKLKMIDQASWTMIIQLCVVWAFMLASLVAYKFALRRLNIS